MLKKVCKKLDRWLEAENKERADAGTIPLRCEIRVIGQTALLEAQIGIELAATMDVDLSNQLHGMVQEKFDEFLAEYGKAIDPVGHEAWMPVETQYDEIYGGLFVKCLIALPEYVLVSKAKMAPEKNKNLIIEYLGLAPTPLFFDLASSLKPSLVSLSLSRKSIQNQFI